MIGLIVFSAVLVLTQYLAWQQHLINKDAEQHDIEHELNVIKDRLKSSLSYGLSATKTLAFIVEEYGVPEDFDHVAKEILESSKFVDALELTREGVITHVYPLKGNEAVIGYDVLGDSLRNKEAFDALHKRELFFAGPLELKQGGIAVVGRLPIFVKDKFWGFSVVLIKLSTLLEAAGIEPQINEEYRYQLSKINPTTHQEEFFLANSVPDKTKSFASIDVPDGEWKLYVIPKSDTGYNLNVIIFSLFGLILSCTGGVFAWHFTNQPEILTKLVEEKTEKLAVSERYFRSLIESSSDAVVLVDANGKVLDQSPSAERITGYSVEELQKLDGKELLHPDSRQGSEAMFVQLLAMPGKTVHRNHRLKHKKGHYIWLEGTYKNLLNDEHVRAIVYNYHDVTERIETEQRLSESEELYRQLIQSLPEAVYNCNVEGRILVFNQAAIDLWGRTPHSDDKWCGSYKIFKPDGAPVPLEDCPMAVCLQEKRSLFGEELIIERPDGTKRYVLAHPTPIFDMVGELTGSVNILIDISDLKKSEEELQRKSHELNERVKELNSLYQISEISNRDEFSVDDILKRCVTLIPPAYQYPEVTCSCIHFEGKVFCSDSFQQTQWKQEAEIMLLGKSIGRIEVFYTKKKSHEYEGPFLKEERLLINSIATVIGSAVERRRAKDEIQASQRKYQLLFENNPLPMWMLSLPSYAIVDVNDAAIDHYGYSREEFLKLNARDLRPKEELERFETQIVSMKRVGTNRIGIWKHKKKNGEIILADVVTHDIQSEGEDLRIVLAIDVTERERAEAKLKESETRLADAQAVAKVGNWETDLATLHVIWSDETFRIFEIEPDEFPKSHPGFLEYVHPEDRAKVDAAFLDSFNNPFINVVDHRIITPRGTEKVLEERWKIVRAEDGKPIKAMGTCQDITERKKIEDQIIAEKILSDSIINSLPGIFYLYDRTGKFFKWNKNFETVSGYSSSEIKTMHPLDFYDTDEKELLKERIETVFSTGYSDVTAHFFTKNKEKVPYYFNGSKVNFNGVDYLIGMGIDITERVKAEAELRKHTEEIGKLSLVASKTDNIVIITDADERIEWVNESFVKLTGYSLEEAVGKTPRILQGPETDRFVLDRIQRHLKAAEPVSEELLNYSKDGRQYWLRININPAFNSEGKLTKFIAVETDVTAQKVYERNVVAIARELSDLIENANAVIFGVDRNGYVNDWNKQAIAVTGYSKNDVLGQKLTNLIIGTQRKAEVDTILTHVLNGNVLNHQEFGIINKANNRLILLLSATPRRNEAGEIIGLIAVGQDITELTQYRHSLEEKVKERTRELNISLEKEKELAVLKTRFASMVSHEFRTPLTTIKLSASHIKRYKTRMDADAIDNKLDTVLQQVAHMAHLLEDVLTLGKTNDHKIQIVKTKVNLVEFFNAIKEQTENVFNHSHTIQYEFKLKHPEINTDADLLQNIFINLLSNAIKFSPEASMVYLNGYEKDHQVILEVRDQGIGIPESDWGRIFEPFDRGSNSGAIPGTGLGLSIVKKGVDLLGGQITVSSKQGEGSVFTVCLPIE